MRAGGVRGLAVAAACLLGLAGCESAGKLPNPFASAATSADPDSTGSVPGPFPGVPPSSQPLTPELTGKDPSDNLSLGKKYYRAGSFGLAEQHFRRSVETNPNDAESWIGLAASYDRLKRFDLADRAYAQAVKIAGATPEIMNNQGFSYMLRGDYARARTTLLAARARDPGSPYIKNNLKMLETAVRKRKGVE